MSKLLFTFKWGKKSFVTRDELNKILENYYTKDEIEAMFDIINKEIETIDNDFTDLGEQVIDNRRDINLLLRVQGEHSNDIILLQRQVEKNTEFLNSNYIVRFLGVYDATTLYKPNDYVLNTNLKDTYLCIKENQGIPLVNTEYWLKKEISQSIDLSNYYTKTEIDEKLKNYVTLKKLSLNLSETRLIKNYETWGRTNVFEIQLEQYIPPTSKIIYVLPTLNKFSPISDYLAESFIAWNALNVNETFIRFRISFHKSNDNLEYPPSFKDDVLLEIYYK